MTHFKAALLAVFLTANTFFAIAYDHGVNVNHHADVKQKHVATMANQVEFSDTWARATFALAKTGAAYMQLKNTSQHQVRLVSASVSDSVAGMTELHHTKMEDGMMRMQELEGGVLIPANETVLFTPGGKHIMLMGLTGPLNAGDSIDVTLLFEDDSSVTLNFEVRDAR